jgi:hypothetical protein
MGISSYTLLRTHTIEDKISPRRVCLHVDETEENSALSCGKSSAKQHVEKERQEAVDRLTNEVTLSCTATD